MPINNWLGGAEASHATSKLYKDKVSELLQLDGFILIQTSSDVGRSPDLLFRKPDTEGNTDIYVETKYDDVSLSDTTFLSELATYFIEYTSKKSEPPDIYLYFRRLKNFSKWRQIFDANKYDEGICKAFFETMVNNKALNEQIREKVKNWGFDHFKKFVADTYVNQINYDGLLMKIDERNKGKKNPLFGYQYYIRELSPMEGRQQIIGNFAEILNYSGSIYSWEIRYLNYRDIYARLQKYEPAVLRGKYLYSLDRKYGTKLREFLKHDTFKTSNSEDWFVEVYSREGENTLSILQTLYKKYILNFGVSKKGCKYIRYKASDILFFSHADYSQERTKVDGKQVTRLFKKTTSPFVKHEAIEIEVKIYDQRLFLFCNPLVLFTDNNRELITGGNVKRLHEKFSPNKYDTNPSILGDMRWWFNYLNDKNESLLETSDLLNFVGKLKPPKDSKTRNFLAAYERIEKYFV
jgi:hypothetical protein